jgi:hypothetical protein
LNFGGLSLGILDFDKITQYRRWLLERILAENTSNFLAQNFGKVFPLCSAVSHKTKRMHKNAQTNQNKK